MFGRKKKKSEADKHYENKMTGEYYDSDLINQMREDNFTLGAKEKKKYFRSPLNKVSANIHTREPTEKEIAELTRLYNSPRGTISRYNANKKAQGNPGISFMWRSPPKINKKTKKSLKEKFQLW